MRANDLNVQQDAGRGGGQLLATSWQDTHRQRGGACAGPRSRGQLKLRRSVRAWWRRIPDGWVKLLAGQINKGRRGGGNTAHNWTLTSSLYILSCCFDGFSTTTTFDKRRELSSKARDFFYFRWRKCFYVFVSLANRLMEMPNVRRVPFISDLQSESWLAETFLTSPWQPAKGSCWFVRVPPARPLRATSSTTQISASQSYLLAALLNQEQLKQRTLLGLLKPSDNGAGRSAAV